MLGCQKLHSNINKLSISFEIIGKNENDDGMYDALKEGFESINIPINTGEDTEIMDYRIFFFAKTTKYSGCPNFIGLC